MATPLENLEAQYANALTRLAEMDPTTLDEGGVRMTYTDKGVMMDWNAYRASLQKIVDDYPKQVEGLLKAQQMIAGPFTVIGRAGC